MNKWWLQPEPEPIDLHNVEEDSDTLKPSEVANLYEAAHKLASERYLEANVLELEPKDRVANQQGPEGRFPDGAPVLVKAWENKIASAKVLNPEVSQLVAKRTPPVSRVSKSKVRRKEPSTYCLVELKKVREASGYLLQLDFPTVPKTGGQV